MTTEKKRTKEFFQGDKRYSIPVYQRAYAWEEGQLRVFFDDLLEATSGGGAYFFGNILLEKRRDDEGVDETLEVIDGQQRLSTIIIFVSSLVKILEARGGG